jgi:Transposase DDE domain
LKQQIKKESTMLELSTSIKYPVLLIKSIGKKSFENLGRVIKKSGDTISRLLVPKEISFAETKLIAVKIFEGKKHLCVGIDDTLIKKIYSKYMQGSGRFYDTKIGRRIMAYRLVIGIITDGKHTVPIHCAYLFSKEIIDTCKLKAQTKEDIAKIIIEIALKLFPASTCTVVVDGLYATVEMFRWCTEQQIRLEARMHSNRKVIYNGVAVKVKDLLLLPGLCPIGRQMARSIQISWHNINLELTIVRRIDKHGDESIVFQAATYHALPREHVENYKKRWKIEKLHRTTKQLLGLQDCYSRVLETQYNHIAATLLAYALLQLDIKKHRIETPEEAIRRCKTKNVWYTIERYVNCLGPKSNFYA